MGKQRRACVSELIHAVRRSAGGLQHIAGAPHAPGRPAMCAAELLRRGARGTAGVPIRACGRVGGQRGRQRAPEGAEGVSMDERGAAS